jgi:hypothetical protein
MAVPPLVEGRILILQNEECPLQHEAKAVAISLTKYSVR